MRPPQEDPSNWEGASVCHTNAATEISPKEKALSHLYVAFVVLSPGTEATAFPFGAIDRALHPQLRACKADAFWAHHPRDRALAKYHRSVVRQTNLTNESAAYLASREELRLAEVDSMRQLERVAELRRRLPEGAIVEDYEFTAGPADLDAGDEPSGSVRLSELFGAVGRPLIVFQLMFGKKQTSPCPMCTMWIDGYNSVAHHLAQNVDFAIAAAADVPALRAHARSRGWNNLRLLSCGNSTFKYDMASEDAEGNQDSTISVFTRDSNGTLRHFYTAHPWLAEDINQRGVDRLTPVWNMLDLTPQGRGDWYPTLSYQRSNGRLTPST